MRNEPENWPLLLRIDEASKLLNVSRSTLYKLIAQGVVPSIRLGGGSLRVPREVLQNWLNEQLTTQ